MERKLFHEKDVRFTANKASGPGGQNINKRSTAVRLRIHIDDLNCSDKIQILIRKHIPPKNWSDSGDIYVECSAHRSRSRNRKIARDKLEKVIVEALNKGVQKQQNERWKKRISKNKTGKSSRRTDRQEKEKRKRRSQSTQDFLQQALKDDPDLRQKLD